MKLIAVTQRVDVSSPHGERRDALDQRWSLFLAQCGLVAVPLPNNPELAAEIVRRVAVQGLLLTGGNTLACYGGDAPERDRTEDHLLTLASERDLPVIGVCRGMQMIQHWSAVQLVRVSGHVTPEHEIQLNGRSEIVNSYHDYGATDSVPDLIVQARSTDGVVEAVRHRKHRVCGMMWHPERYAAFPASDVDIFRDWFHSA